MSSEVDGEAPTPRLTALWSVHEEHAHQLSERLRTIAQASTDMLRSRRLRDLSDVAEDYARAFRRWSLEDVAVAQKMRERAAFSLLSQTIAAEIEP